MLWVFSPIIQWFALTFTNNSVKGEGSIGGALAIEATTATIKGNTTFSGNTAAKGGAIYVGDAAKLVIDSTNAEIKFIGNKLLTGTDGKVVAGAAGSDLYLGKTSTGAAGIATFTGNGLIDFQGSIAGVAESSITSDAADVRIADASKFAGSYSVNGGKTTIAGDKYFGGAVNVTKGELVAGKAVLLNPVSEDENAELPNQVSGGKFTADSVTIGRVASGEGATAVTAVESGLSVTLKVG